MTINEVISMMPQPTEFVGKRFKRFSAVLEVDGQRTIAHFSPLEWKSRAGALALIRESYPNAKALLVTR